MTKITVTKIGIPKAKSNGKLRNYLMAQEYPNKFLSFFCSPETDKFQVGQSYEVDIKENPGMGKNGPTTYYNLSVPKSKVAFGGSNLPTGDLKVELMALSHSIDQKLSPLIIRLDKIIAHLAGEEKLGFNSDGSRTPSFELEHRKEMDEGFQRAMDKDFDSL